MKNTAGCINCHKKKANNTENIRACLSIECITPLRDCGNMADSIREPSSGGIGTKLKVASTKFVKTIISRAKIAGFGKFTAKNLIDRPAMTAITILESGPAKATSASPLFPDLKALKLTGTGFAQPRIRPRFKTTHIKGNNTDPKGSICFIGFNVRRPISLAVWSPWLRAARPCDTSCITTENINIKTESIIVAMSIEV